MCSQYLRLTIYNLIFSLTICALFIENVLSIFPLMIYDFLFPMTIYNLTIPVTICAQTLKYFW